MRSLIFHLKKIINDVTNNQIVFALSLGLLALLIIGVLLFLKPLMLELSKSMKIKHTLESNVLSIKSPKQQFFPKDISTLHKQLAVMLKENQFYQYDLIKSGFVNYNKQCFSRFEIKANSAFKNCMSFLRFLSQHAFFIEFLTFDRAEDGQINFDLGVMGFCGDFGQCESVSS